ncbi:MAG TPA: PPC domain-containing protein [Jatrophihabitans sp.]|uniref:pre-peptidase C-terminal domain-containing protein n=1 Tax=Jatrophihabitans sp. TaxID=1932789 RepID=UPI002EE14311
MVPTRTIQATPSNYRLLLADLVPGERLLLAAGTYTQGLSFWNRNGQPDKCLIVEGPASGPPAVFTNSPDRNIVSFKDASYIAVRNLSLDGQGIASDGVRDEAHGTSAHHILIEGLSFKNFNATQITAINTKCPAWNWVVRNNTITSTYTGMYFGNSDGAGETTNFLVENNLVYGTLGYNAQFKHQLTRNTSIGMPSTGTTIIRNNVFSKETGSISGSAARPNLLVGHWPTSGAGASDIYQIYGNLFYQNPYEGLFQGEGNVAFHDNLLVNRSNAGMYFQPHNSVPKRVDIFNNTVVTSGTGIRITGGDPAYSQRIVGNAVFAGTPLSGGQQSNNVTGSHSAASTYLNNPTAALGAGLDLYPKTGQLQGAAIDYSAFTGLTDYNRDFNYQSRITTYRGAYSGDGVNPGWTPALAIKPQPAPSNVLQNGVAITGLSGATGSQRFWTMTVPAGASNLMFQTSGGTGDADPYVRFGSAPTTTAYDCGPVTGDNNETCAFGAPAPGTWHVMIDGYAAFSGMTLMASYQTSPTCTSVTELEPNNSVTAPQAISGPCNQISGTYLNDSATQQNDYFRLSLPAGRTATAQLYGLSVDYDLEIYYAGTKVAQSYHSDTNGEQASWTNTTTSAVTVYIRVDRYTSPQAAYKLGVSY